MSNERLSRCSFPHSPWLGFSCSQRTMVRVGPTELSWSSMLQVFVLPLRFNGVWFLLWFRVFVCCYFVEIQVDAHVLMARGGDCWTIEDTRFVWRSSVLSVLVSCGLDSPWLKICGGSESSHSCQWMVVDGSSWC